MRAVELFAGVGGFRLGLDRAGVKTVWANEWDKHAAAVYRKRFGAIDTRDITTVRPGEIPKHDLITGGFPCQAFSIAGKRKGFRETRGTLFFDIMRIARHHRTPYLVLENVKGLLNHEGGDTFETILRALDQSGYDCQWEVLNSKDFGVPQNRERVFIVGHLRGRPRPQVFPIGKSDSDAKQGNRKRQNAQSITTQSRGNARGTHIQELTGNRSERKRVYHEDGIAATIAGADGGGGGREPKVAVRALTEARTDEAKQIRRESMRRGKDFSPRRGKKLVERKDDVANTVTAVQTVEQMLSVTAQGVNHPSRGIEPRKDGLAATIKSGESGTQKPKVMVSKTVRSGGQKSPHGDKRNWDSYEVGNRIRRLTPVECERLQGWPDGHTSIGELADGTEYPMSDTQRYKQAGNGVTSNVVEAVARRLCETT